MREVTKNLPSREFKHQISSEQFIDMMNIMFEQFMNKKPSHLFRTFADCSQSDQVPGKKLILIHEKLPQIDIKYCKIIDILIYGENSLLWRGYDTIIIISNH